MNAWETEHCISHEWWSECSICHAFHKVLKCSYLCSSFQVNFSKKRKNRMRNDEAAIIALSKSRSQYLHKDTDSLVDNEAVIVYDERTALWKLGLGVGEIHLKTNYLSGTAGNKGTWGQWSVSGVCVQTLCKLAPIVIFSSCI